MAHERPRKERARERWGDQDRDMGKVEGGKKRARVRERESEREREREREREGERETETKILKALEGS